MRAGFIRKRHKDPEQYEYPFCSDAFGKTDLFFLTESRDLLLFLENKKVKGVRQ